MKEGPEFKIVGNINELEQKKVGDFFRSKTHDHVETMSGTLKEDISKFEFKKEEKEVSVIERASELVDELLNTYNLAPYKVSPENIHKMDKAFFQKAGFKGDALADFQNQGIYIGADASKRGFIYFAQVILHEMLHLKSYTAFQVRPEIVGTRKELRSGLYRNGVSVNSSIKANSEGNRHEHFIGLQEAIVQTETNKLFSKIFEHPDLKLENDFLNSDEYKNSREKISKELGVEATELFPVDIEKSQWAKFAYKAQRDVLWYVCEQISKTYENSNKEEIYNKFLKAQFTGELLSLAHMVESVFGKGSFRTLGDMTDYRESANECLEKLTKKK